MKSTDHREHTEAPLGGFELRLLRSLTEIDRGRPVTTPGTGRKHRRGRHRRPAVVAGVTAAATLVGAAATAGGMLAVSSGGGDVVAAGSPLVMKGSGCGAGAALTLWLDRDVPLGTTTVRADGLYIATVTVPVTTAPGRHEIRAMCDGPNGTDLVQTLALRVTEAGPPEPLDPVFDASGGATVGGIALFKGAGCRPDSAVAITVAGIPGLEISTTAADAGQFVATGFVPADTAVGGYRARAECVAADGQAFVQHTELTVREPQPTESAGTKPAR
ncbi:MAG TPA: hypothetical protein VKG85_04655 [Actinomycetes bacterium]|nr:hypothetical protein [Actinomycetes bacterium]